MKVAPCRVKMNLVANEVVELCSCPLHSCLQIIVFKSCESVVNNDVLLMSIVLRNGMCKDDS